MSEEHAKEAYKRSIEAGDVRSLTETIQMHPKYINIFLGTFPPYTPLGLAVKKNKPRMAEQLLKANADISLGDGKWGTSPLGLAIFEKSEECTLLLLRYNATLSSTADKIQMTPELTQWFEQKQSQIPMYSSQELPPTQERPTVERKNSFHGYPQPMFPPGSPGSSPLRTSHGSSPINTQLMQELQLLRSQQEQWEQEKQRLQLQINQLVADNEKLKRDVHQWSTFYNTERTTWQQCNALQQLESKISKQETESQLRVAELGDFLIAPRPVGKAGSFGVVHAVQTNWNSLQLRIDIPPVEARAGYNFVALKMLFNFQDQEKSMQLKKKFDQEYNVCLTHPHWSIIRVFNYFSSDVIPDLLPPDHDRRLYGSRTTYFTMELGLGTLKEFLAHYPALQTKEYWIISLQILLGVTHLASVNYAHLDLKSDNIICLMNTRRMIEGHQFVIGDLGTAKQSPLRLNPGEAIPGNQINRAPETWNSSFPEVDVSKADVWAVGCMIYEIFHRRHPFYDSHNQDGLRNRICYLELPSCDPQWGSGLARLLQLMWIRQPTYRISGWCASRLCAMLLWEFSFTPNVSKDDCEAWIRDRKFKLYRKLFPAGVEPPTVHIESFLELHILLNTSADDLLECNRIYFSAT